MAKAQSSERLEVNQTRLLTHSTYDQCNRPHETRTFTHKHSMAGVVGVGGTAACRAVACLIPRKLPLGAALIHTSTPSALNAGKRGRGCGAGFCKLSFPLLSSLTLSPRLHLKQQAKAKPSSAVQFIAVLSLRCSRTPQLRGILEGEKSSTNSCVLTKFTCFLLLALESGRIPLRPSSMASHAWPCPPSPPVPSLRYRYWPVTTMCLRVGRARSLSAQTPWRMQSHQGGALPPSRERLARAHVAPLTFSILLWASVSSTAITDCAMGTIEDALCSSPALAVPDGAKRQRSVSVLCPSCQCHSRCDRTRACLHMSLTLSPALLGSRGRVPKSTD